MVSVIIPALEEEARLPRCLDACVGQATTVGAEVLVVDGGSRDRTRELAAERDGVRVLSASRGRGRQMNAGARASSGTLLAFLHADTLLPPGAVAVLDRIDRAEAPRAGGFRQRFDRRRPLLEAVSALHNLRASLTGVFYGDQTPFVRRDLFLELGGYREDVDMEDVELGARIRRRTRPRRLELTVTTSARRFDRAGDLRAVAVAAVLLGRWLLFRHVPPSKTFFTPVR